MGSGASTKALRQSLKVAADELAEERRRAEEKDSQLTSVQVALREQLDSSREESVQITKREMCICELRSELRAGETEHAGDLQRLTTELSERHHTEVRNLRQEYDETLEETFERRAKQATDDAQMQRETLEQAHHALVQHLREAAEAVSERHRSEIERSETTITRLRDDAAVAQGERNQVEEALREARELVHEAQLQQAHASASSRQRASKLERRCSQTQLEHVAASASSADRASCLEQRLAEVQHDRDAMETTCSDMERAFAQTESYNQAEQRELRVELRRYAEQLDERGAALRQTEDDLRDLNGQFDELQDLFAEVTNQLQVECSRVAAMQENVAVCAKQTNELEQLRVMLDDSHAMLAQLREALDEERAERLKASGLLDHEQKRTKVLLDVLRSFKEKLQGLTPQMLLNRVGASDLKELATLVGSNSAQPSPADAKSTVARAVSISALSPAPAPSQVANSAATISTLPPCPLAPGLRHALRSAAGSDANVPEGSPTSTVASACADSARDAAELSPKEDVSESAKLADDGGQVESHYIGSPGSTTARSPSPRNEFTNALAS